MSSVGRRFSIHMTDTTERSGFVYMHKLLKQLMILLLCTVLIGTGFAPASVSAASRPVTISSCKISGKSKVRVTAVTANPRKISGSRCYLFALTPGMSARPVASCKKSKKMTFTCKLNSGGVNLLNSGFAVASRNSSGKYTYISTRRFISNPGALAKYRYRFPKSISKKGLQVNADMMEDAEELNVRNSVINIDFSQLIAPPALQNSRYSYSWKYQGQTYWFVKDSVSYYDRQLLALNSTSSVNSAVLLLSWRSDLTSLIYPQGRQQGHAFYAWNTKDRSARKQLQATLNFLARRYSTSTKKYGQISNWIIGNEVNNYNTYNYAGSQTLRQYSQIYADQFRLAYNTLVSVYSNARVYISLDHLWNTNYVNGTFASRKMLDSFASKIRAGGNLQWNLAYHPYSSPLTEPRFWANTNGQLTKSLTTPVINMGNIRLLTSYIRQKYGSKTRIILSETGYTSVQRKHNVENQQAAAVAYSYLLAESDNMIDSLIIHRQIDHKEEIKQGLNLGLWTTDARSADFESANTKKKSWSVFKYMDSSRSASETAFIPSTIGVSNWKSLIPSYSSKLYNKSNCTIGALEQVNAYRRGASIYQSWSPYGAVTTSHKTGNTFTALHDIRRNKNSLWGFSQKMKRSLSFKSYPNFCTTLRASGAQNGYVQIKLRFYSRKHIFECARIVPADQTVRLKTSLAKWKYRSKVTKIQVMAAPVNGSQWNANAQLVMNAPVRSR